MGVEIERKFLVIPEHWNPEKEGKEIKQGYLSTDPERNVRVRIYGGDAFLTIKGKTVGISRTEIEYPIPLDDATELLQLCHRPLIEKLRYTIPESTLMWEVDIFSGENEGLMIAEIELPDEATTFEKPAWVGEEVTTDFRYSNSSLCEKPFRTWSN
ncbi:MAG: adenylate cyclase [Verrucomicrobiales bacterium]|nr:adenylate cyclase [Verrucomicrobiales bacterium]